MPIKKYQLKEIKTLNAHKSGVTTISLNENRNILVSGSNDGTVILWNMKDYSYKTIHKIDEEITSISFNSKGDFIAIGGKNKKITIYDYDFSILKEINVEANVSSLKFNSDDSLLIYTLDNGNIYFYDFNQLKILKELKLNLFYPNSMIFNDKKDILFVSGYTNKVILINLKTLDIIKEIRLTLNESITSISYLNDEKILVATDLGSIFILNISSETQENIEVLRGSNITISSYQNYLLTGGDFTESKLKIFDIKTKNILINQYVHNSDINSIIIYNNGKNIITSSTDNTIKIFNLSF
ncbi:MAG: hypothetical protein ACK4IX_01030 [Candidatus Sericytochromatia bacterium]